MIDCYLETPSCRVCDGQECNETGSEFPTSEPELGEAASVEAMAMAFVDDAVDSAGIS